MKSTAFRLGLLLISLAFAAGENQQSDILPSSKRIDSTVAVVGRAFEYSLSNQAQHKDEYKVVQRGQASLPQWLSYIEEKSLLLGVPTWRDRGDFFIDFQSKDGNIEHSLKIQVKDSRDEVPQPSSRSNNTKTSSYSKPKCSKGLPVAAASIVLDFHLEKVTGEMRVEIMKKVHDFVDVDTKNLHMLAGKGHNTAFGLKDVITVTAGPGNVADSKQPGVVVSWQIGCGIDIPIAGVRIASFLKSSTETGSFGPVLGLPVTEWHVSIGYPRQPRQRARRQVVQDKTPKVVKRSTKRNVRAIQATPTPTLTVAPPTSVVARVTITVTRTSSVVSTPTVAPTTTPVVPTTTEEPTPSTTPKLPTTTEKLTTTEEPTPSTTPKLPTTTEKLTTTEEPTPSTTPKLPTTTEKLTTTEEPTTTRPPTTTEKPTTTKRPTSTEPPTTTEEPTTTDEPTTPPTTKPTTPERTTTTSASTTTTLSTTVEVLSTTERPTSSTTQKSSTTRTKKPTVKTSEKPIVTNPKVLNHIDRLDVYRGQARIYHIPADTFYDNQDLFTPNLTLSLKTNEWKPLSEVPWIEFDPENQVIYISPVDEGTIGIHEFFLVASDSDGEEGYDAFEVNIVSDSSVSYNHRFRLELDYDYNNFSSDFNIRFKLLSKLAEYFEVNTSSVRVVSFTQGSVIYKFQFDSSAVPFDDCDFPLREKFVSEDVDEDGDSVNPDLKEALGPEFPVKSGLFEGLGPCKGGAVVPVTKQRSGTSKKYIIIPVVILAIVLLIIGVCLFVIIRSRRQRKLSLEDQKLFVDKRKPAVLQEEYEVKERLLKQPLVLPNEKPPLSPPVHPRSPSLKHSGSDPPPSAGYQAPSFTSSRQPSIQGTPSGNSPRKPGYSGYRLPPAYVPP